MSQEQNQLTINSNDTQFECSQALGTLNINVEEPQLLENRPKKMSSNRRKKLKIKLKKQQSRKALHQIIKSMCCLKSNFQQNLKTIDALLQIDLDEDRFYQFISRVTRQQMDILGQQIHSLTANFCTLYKQDKAINPAQIARLFQMISIVKQASIQIERVINYFIIKGNYSDFQSYMHRDLQFSTLKYIVESDPMKKDFQVFCHAFIQTTKDKRQKIIIQQIINRFKAAQQFSQQNDQCLQCFEELQTSAVETQQTKKKKKKKKNKMKIQQQDIRMQMLTREIQVYKQVIKNLKELVIWEGQRQSCCIEQQWLYKIKKKIQNELL